MSGSAPGTSTASGLTAVGSAGAGGRGDAAAADRPRCRSPAATGTRIEPRSPVRRSPVHGRSPGTTLAGRDLRHDCRGPGCRATAVRATRAGRTAAVGCPGARTAAARRASGPSRSHRGRRASVQRRAVFTCFHRCRSRRPLPTISPAACHSTGADRPAVTPRSVRIELAGVDRQRLCSALPNGTTGRRGPAGTPDRIGLARHFPGGIARLDALSAAVHHSRNGGFITSGRPRVAHGRYVTSSRCQCGVSDPG
jgi:hypothetical protein